MTWLPGVAMHVNILCTASEHLQALAHLSVVSEHCVRVQATHFETVAPVVPIGPSGKLVVRISEPATQVAVPASSLPTRTGVSGVVGVVAGPGGFVVGPVVGRAGSTGAVGVVDVPGAGGVVVPVAGVVPGVVAAGVPGGVTGFVGAVTRFGSVELSPQPAINAACAATRPMTSAYATLSFKTTIFVPPKALHPHVRGELQGSHVTHTLCEHPTAECAPCYDLVATPIASVVL